MTSGSRPDPPGPGAPTPSRPAQERAAEDVDLLRRRVLNVIPHALRTPITTFRGLAEALPTATEDDIRTAIAPALQRLSAQAEHLLDDMLLAAGITSTLPTGPAVAQPVAETARLVWADVAPGRAPLRVDGDETAALVPEGTLVKMFVHLLDNAVTYGGEDPVVRVRRRGRRAVVAVESPGDVVDDVSMLGEPFFRGERAVMVAPGLGVGLAVTRALAEHAGGTLVIEARSGGGLVTILDLVAA